MLVKMIIRQNKASPSPSGKKLRKFAKPAGKSPRRVSSIDKDKETKIGCMASFAEQLAAKYLKESELVTNTRRTGTQSVYEPTWNKWTSWCHQQQVDLFRCPVNFVLKRLIFFNLSILIGR